MNVDPFPNTEDQRDLDEAHASLAQANILPGPGGYDLETLAAAAYDHGWSYRIDRATGMAGYQVELRPQHGIAAQPSVSAIGWEPDVALALALARALPPSPSGSGPQPGQSGGQGVPVITK
jgi:hypothetical protein